MIGKTVSHYKIFDKLGQGGMGVVYKAQDTKLDRFVALKFLPPQIGVDEQEKKRFIQEAKAASSLDHNNICTIYEINETDDGQMFIAMGYYEGETLKDKMTKGPLRIDEAVNMAIQIATGLDKAHKKGIVHRDIKPANIFIIENNLVKILDFGLAKLSGQTRLTKDGNTLGTVAYMSPEQTRGADVDSGTDIWSLGVVLYEMLSGEMPFKGDYEQAVVYSIVNEEPEPITSLRSGVPMELERIVAKAMAKDPAERYQHVDEMQVDIKLLRKEHDSVKSATKRIKSNLPNRGQTFPIGSQKTVERSISQRLSKSSMGAFVGRKQELDMLLHAFSSPELPFVVSYLHGQGGIGKSCFLQNLISRITPDVGITIFIDCRDTEPTIAGFLDSLSSILGIEDEEPTLEEVLSHLFKIKDRMLLCLDQYENFILMDTWLRQIFVPALPDTVLTVLASRYPPKTAWLTTPGWQELFREIELKELSDEESTQMLDTRRLNENQIKQVKKFSHGHPLTLELGAAALRSQPDLVVHAGPPAKIVPQLSRALLSDLSHDMLEAVEAVSTVRWTTEPILRALLVIAEVRNIFDKLRELPFVYSTQEGLIIHDLVQEAVSKDLSSRDPKRYGLYRSRAWHFFSTESRQAQEHHLWHLTGDMIYLIENPIIREAFFPKGSSDYVLQIACTDDYVDIKKIARGEETPEAARQIEAWLNQYPDSFSVAMGPDRKVAGFYFCFEPYKVDEKLLANDPLTAAWSKHLEQNPVKPEERVLFLRRWLAHGTGDNFSPVQGACWVDIKRTYMEMRPHLRRLYTTVNDLAAYAPVVVPLGFAPIDDAHVDLGGKTYYSAVLDFGVGSVDGWLNGLVKAELGVDPTDA